MSAALPCGALTIFGLTRGRIVPGLTGGSALGNARLPTDSIGSFTLTLTNLVVGSVIRIEIASTGAEVETRTADTTSEVFVIPAYSGGSAFNDLRIKVRKGSGTPFYRPFETLATALIGAQSIYIAQIPD